MKPLLVLLISTLSASATIKKEEVNKENFPQNCLVSFKFCPDLPRRKPPPPFPSRPVGVPFDANLVDSWSNSSWSYWAWNTK